MELVSLAQVRPGAVLAAEVANREGAVLCPKGFRLDEAAIARIERAGIQAVIVEGGSAEYAPDYDNRLAALEARFAGIDDPVMVQLKATMERVLRSLAAETPAQE